MEGRLEPLVCDWVCGMVNVALRTFAMQFLRPNFAEHPMRFGRGPVRVTDDVAAQHGLAIADDVKLFAATFVAGFLFVSILIG